MKLRDNMKFECTQIQIGKYNGATGKELRAYVTLAPINAVAKTDSYSLQPDGYDDPYLTGSISLHVSPATAQQDFKVGEEYTLSIKPAEGVAGSDEDI